MLKKMFLTVFALGMCLSLAACGENKTSGNESSVKEKSVKEESTKEEGTEETGTGETEKSEEAEPVPENTESESKVLYEPSRFDTDELTWEFDAGTGTLFVHGEGPMRQYSSEMPKWEQHKDEICAVVLDDGITSVGAYAFYNYMNLTKVTLPDSVEVIDVSAFDYDWELSEVNIPSSLKYVGYRAFYNTMLHEPADLVFPEGLEYIGDLAFHSAVKSGGKVSLPSTLKYLGAQSFTNSYLSDFVVSPENQAYCCADHAVYTKDMKELMMAAPVSEGRNEFFVPDGVEKIDAECFNVVTGIERIIIPASVKEIEESAFFSTFDLKEIVVDAENPAYKSENGLLLSKDGTLLLAWPDAIEGNALVIPDGVQRIGAYLFYGRTEGGYTVVLPEGVKEIGTMSLPYDMASLSLPASLEKINDNVFYEGISIGSVTYAASAEDWEKIEIGEGNTGLSAINIQMK